MVAPVDSDKTQLKLGLAAAKRQDYGAAIAHLQQVQPGPRYEQAQMALVVSLEKTGALGAAIARCQPLVASAKAETRQWAEGSLAKLHKRLATAKKAEVWGQAVPPPPRWQALSPLPASRWTWAGLMLLLVWGLRQLHGAIAWPGGWLPYSGWLLGGLGAIAVGLVWLNHRRLAHSLAPLSLRLQELVTLLVLAWLVPHSLRTSLDLINALLIKLPWVRLYLLTPERWLDRLWLLALPLLLALPWVWSAMLRLYHRWEPLSPQALELLSPTTKELWRQHRRRHNVGPPKLLKLHSPLPWIVSYGHRPRNLRIVISQGLLERLGPEQIAALVAGELGQAQTQATVVLPWLLLLLQLPFGLYWFCSRLGNLCQAKLKQPMDAGFRFLFRTGLGLTGGLGAIAYGAFKLWRWPLLWLSRSRALAGDRAAADLLADPNAYSRALLAYAQALADAVATEQQTPAIAEAFEPLLPVGLPEALTLGLAPTALPLAERLAWDAASPYRRWLGLNNAHPPLGDRLARLGQLARQQGGQPQLALPQETTALLNPLGAWAERSWEKRRLALNRSFAAWKPLLYQGFPFYGALLGLAFGYGLWGLGATASLFGQWWFDWMWGDRRLIWGCMPLGIGLGLIVRTNRFFPQRAQREQSTEAAVQALLPDRQTLPLEAVPVAFEGKLQGRAGLANWLGQDLLLLTQQGPLRLHWCSPLGPAGNLWPKFLRPSLLLGREVVVIGWLRRGATLWLDVEQIKTRGGGRSSQRGHPMWAAVMAAIAILWGVVILLPSR